MRCNFVKKMAKGLLAAAAVMFTCQAVQVMADVSVNYMTNNTRVISNAGVEFNAVWNNVQTLSASSLVDDSGNATTMGAVVSSGGFDSWNTGGDNDQLLYSDWINAGAGTTLGLSGISYANYDLIIYHSHYAAGETVNYTIGATTLSLDSTGIGNVFTQSPTHQLDVTYVRFTGLTGSGQTVTIASPQNGTGIAGFQVIDTTVAIPEPSTFGLGLATMGLIGCVRRRRRS